MMLDAGEPRVRREKNVETVTGHRKTEAVGFLRTRFDRFGGDVFDEFDDLNADRFLFVHNSTRLVGSFDQVTTLRAQRPSRWRSHQPCPRRPDPWTADLTESSSVTLGHRPFVVVLLDIWTGGYPEMQVELADKVEQMAVAVDETRKNRFAFRIDDPASARNGDLTTLAHRFKSIAF